MIQNLLTYMEISDENSFRLLQNYVKIETFFFFEVADFKMKV